MGIELPQAWFFVLAGFVGGIALFARGLIAYRRDRLVSSVATSSLDAIAAGEVRISGTVSAAGTPLISPIRSEPCVWYRARVETTGDDSVVLLDDERARHFFVDDGSARIRVIPGGARWEIGDVYDERTSITGAEPLGVRPGGAFPSARLLAKDVEHMNELERQAAAQALLTVQRPTGPASAAWQPRSSNALAGLTLDARQRGRRYREARLDVGDTVTIIGQALPWSDVKPIAHTWRPSGNVETDMAEDLAAARAAGQLAASADEAWGNAAIPGFGIGQPVEEPELHPEAAAPEVADDDIAQRFTDEFDIPDDDLVIARGQTGALAVYKGAATDATAHHDLAFLLGIIGAVMAVVSALAFGAMVSGSL